MSLATQMWLLLLGTLGIGKATKTPFIVSLVMIAVYYLFIQICLGPVFSPFGF